VLDKNSKRMDWKQNSKSSRDIVAYPYERQVITPPPRKVQESQDTTIHVTYFPFLRTQPQPSTIPLILVPPQYLYTPTDGLPFLTPPHPIFLEMPQIIEDSTQLSVNTQPQISAYLLVQKS